MKWTRRQEQVAFALLATIFTLCIVWLFVPKARAEDCPPNAKSCKVITLTPEEQDMLIRDKGILQTAVQARPLDLGAIVQYFVTKIEHAPAGKVVEPPKPPEKKEPVAVSPLKPAEKK